MVGFIVGQSKLSSTARVGIVKHASVCYKLSATLCQKYRTNHVSINGLNTVVELEHFTSSAKKANLHKEDLQG